ncbi:DUF4153 domain-containing protein [Paraburkholderia jirisanensis]
MQNEPSNLPSRQPAPDSQRLFVQRLSVGVVQGVLLYALLEAARHHAALAHMPLLFVPLLLVSLYVAPVVVIGLGHLRAARLVLWAVLLGALVALIGYHDAWRAAGSVTRDFFFGNKGVREPSAPATFFIGVAVFIAYALIVAGEAARAWVAPYQSYFENSWKLALQIGLSLIFVGALHLVLWAGAALFMLIKLSFLQELLKQTWFIVPVSSMAFAGALHITDVRPDLIRGTRTLVHSLMSWLLLVLVLITGGFLLSLPFKGLEALWATRSATQILLSVVALTILFVNAVFKGGSSGETAPRVLRICMRAASLMLPLLTALAAYALALRIGQYGLTKERVLACACVLVAACHALGYAWAAVDRRASLDRLAPVNVATAWVSLAVLIALFTPLADPDRLSVNSQVERLLSGRVRPDQFDFAFLRFRSAIYGRQALTRLAAGTDGPDAPRIRELSAKAERADDEDRRVTWPDAAALAHNITSRTPGVAVPASFISNDWRHATEYQWSLPNCLTVDLMRCDAYMVDLNGSGQTNVVVIGDGDNTASIFGQDAAQRWQALGQFVIAPDCTGVRNALADGTFKRVPPALQDIEVNGQRMRIEVQPRRSTCNRK